jgi:hypothetical protein
MGVFIEAPASIAYRSSEKYKLALTGAGGAL